MRKLYRTLISLILLALLIIAGESLGYFGIVLTSSAKTVEQSDGVFEITLSNPDKPAELELEDSNTSMKISGHDGKTIIVELYRRGRKIDTNTMPVTFSENQNKVRISLVSNLKGYELRIKVPTTTSMRLRAEWAAIVEVEDVIGDLWIRSSTTNISVNNVEGNVDILTFSGDISVLNLKGSPLLYNTKGNTTLSFRTLPSEYPNIINSSMGVITLFLERQSDVSLRLKFDTGIFGEIKLETDFDLKALNSSAFPMGADDNSLYRKINEGGAPIYIRTFKGSVRIKYVASVR